MTNSTAPNLNEVRSRLKPTDPLPAKSFALPPEPDGHWDRDTLSGHLLNLFRMTGDHSCFDSFYRLNVERLIRQLSRSPYASAWSYNHLEMAADIFYDIFQAAHTYTFRGGISFRAWMRVITRNKIKKTLRHRSAIPTIRSDNLEEIDTSGTPDPLHRLILRERYRSLLGGWWLLASLCAHGLRHAVTEQECKVLRLHESAGLSYKAISRHLDISLQEVVRIGRRGRRKVVGHIRKRLRFATCHSRMATRGGGF